MKIKFSSFVDPLFVQRFCIKYDFFNSGTNQEYETFLNYIRTHKKITPAVLGYIVNSIIEHTSEYNEYIKTYDQYAREDLAKSIAYDLMHDFTMFRLEVVE